MTNYSRRRCGAPRYVRALPAVFLLVSAPFAALCQTNAQRAVANPLAVLPVDRVTAQIDNRATVTLLGNIHPQARQANDAGPVPADFAMPHLVLVLKRDAAQQAALDALNQAQQDPKSPLYHHWLGPDEFGAHFGVSQNDVKKISAWLVSQGFTIDDIPSSRTTIKFSGTAAQVEAAFHTPIHFYKTADGTHFANTADQKIPQALANVVVGVAALHDFKPRPMGRTKTVARTQPQYAGGNGTYFMAPSDFYTIYDLNPLYSSGTDGTGQTIAVIAPCSTDLTAVSTFWADYVKAGTTLKVNTSGNVSQCNSGETSEAYLDVEWSGAVAKNATILLVESDGTFDAASQAVNNKLAPVVTISYGSCEQNLGAAGTASWASLWQTAASFGISAFVSSGDSGAAGCDDQDTETVATQGLGVNGICSSQYAICVGGTEFNDTASPGNYWSKAGAALGYIPEVAWNESGLVAGGSGIWASGGGYSTTFAKPSWQTGNSSTNRGVPDVAMSAAGHDGYITCEVVSVCGPSSNSFYYSYGTSAATPVFAGIMALVVQKTGQWQGNPATNLYALAAKTSLNIFHDVTSGNNSVPGQVGFSAGPGWDPVTGLGSVDANLLVTNWPGAIPPSGPAVTLSISQLSFGNQVVATASAAQTVTVRSSGTTAVNISSILLTGANTGDFSATTTCPTGALAAGQSCAITVTFKPTATGSRAAAVSIADNAPNTPQTIQLTGTGIPSTPPIAVTNQELSKQTSSGCAVPPATSAFLTSDAVVNLFFDATVAPSDNLTVSWVAPNGATFNGSWTPVPSAGAYCFPASLNISNVSSAQLGAWQVEVFDNSLPVFSLPFTVSSIAIVSNASYLAPVAPGSLISIFPATGVVLSSTSSLLASTIPLPTSLGGTSVTVNGTLAGLLYVDKGQINAQVPPNTVAGQATVVVTGSGTGGTGVVSVVPVAPGLISVATHGDGSYVNSSSPANAGEYITLYGTGQGPVNATQVTGGLNPGAKCLDTSSVTINGQNAGGDYFFCGMSYFVGVTQINAQVPSGLPAGNLPVIFTVNGIASNSINVAVSGH